VITVVPKVRIDRAAGRNGVVTIRGSGFSGYAQRSGTAVRGRFITVRRGRVSSRYVNGTIYSWEDGKIVAKWTGSATPNQVTIRTIFGNTTARVAAATRR
jgi:hypothetical protein